MRGKADYLWGPEAYTQKRQVKALQCRVCRHAVNAGEVFGQTVYDCEKNLKPPRNRVCAGFWLSEDEAREVRREVET